MDKETIKQLFEANRLEDVEQALARCEHTDAWVLYMLGRVAWKRGDKSGAISYYEKAVGVDPMSDAAVALEQARCIMDFFNTDLLNP